MHRSATEILGKLAQRNKAVGDSFTVRTYQAGETIATSAELGQSVFLLASGRVQLYRETREGRRFVMATLGPGSMFGEDSVLGGEGPNASALALEPCTVWVMPRQRALELSSIEAQFTLGLMQAIGQRVVEAENRLEQVAYGTLAARLAALLLELGRDDPQGLIRATHQELADMLGTWRETVSKTLQEFRRRGLVSAGRRQLRLLNRQELAMEAGLSW